MEDPVQELKLVQGAATLVDACRAHPHSFLPTPIRQEWGVNLGV